jgi:hypothetical protein
MSSFGRYVDVRLPVRDTIGGGASRTRSAMMNVEGLRVMKSNAIVTKEVLENKCPM